MTVIDLDVFRAPRPRRADGARNFDAILRAARDAIREEGSDVALETVAERAGVGIATLYRNFPTREVLINHLYVDEIEAIAQDAVAVAGLDPRAALTEWTLRFAEHIGAKQQLASAIDEDGPVYEACVRVIVATSGPVIARARAAGALRPDVTDDDVTRGVYGIATMPADGAEQRQRILEVFLRGLQA
ncbi:TetR/AcrR family transcriptional regulator [Frondihabitans australicus]|uniref:TetR family transcriptional regulator n=1 Tax=Frondihabitans australicus TaxID=386892 RepID=A0A495II64_9MICO|nr:TetR/AcrR family transcriptional regulator [Frondihabitans australicus]RKR75677.1 TetR family transcriptional regulator [Frondihabitans australicus]